MSLQERQIVWLPEQRVDASLALETAWGKKVRESGHGVLLLWRGGSPAIVVGHSQVIQKEISEETCLALGIPVFRRVSGGGAVLQTPGVFNYSLILPEQSGLSIKGGFRLGTELIQKTLRQLGLASAVQGVSDVTVKGRKISGNAVAHVNRVLLVHGTLLEDVDMSLLEACLRQPSREPDYRQGRCHREFLTTLTDLGVWSPGVLSAALENAGSRLLQRLGEQGNPSEF